MTRFAVVAAALVAVGGGDVARVWLRTWTAAAGGLGGGGVVRG